MSQLEGARQERQAELAVVLEDPAGGSGADKVAEAIQAGREATGWPLRRRDGRGAGGREQVRHTSGLQKKQQGCQR